MVTQRKKVDVERRTIRNLGPNIAFLNSILENLFASLSRWCEQEVQR